MNDVIDDLETLPEDIFDNFDASTKCGEIFVSKGEFNYLCTYCGNSFINLQIFSQHLFQNHQIFNFEPILNENYTKYTKYKNNIDIIYNNNNLETTEAELISNPHSKLDSTITLENLILNLDNQYSINNNNHQSLINQEDFVNEKDCQDDHKNSTAIKTKSKSVDIGQRTNSNTLKPFKCEICNKGFCTSKNVVQHREKCALREIPYPCRFCPRKFFILEKCQRHEQSKHSNQINPDIPKGYWRCQICLKILSNTCSRKNHHDKHFLKFTSNTAVEQQPKSRLISCTICEKQLSSNASLKVHMRIHSGENRFKCSYCPAAFKFSTSLKTHELSHTGERQFSCRYCSKRFLQKSHRQNHELLHANEKKYECNECNMKFFRKDYLDSHVKNKHRNLRKDENRPYQCKYCKSSFTAEKYLKNHQRLHEMGKEHQCKYCDRKSVVKGIIERHERTHLKLKEYYDCTLCPKKFESRNGLISHQRIKHPNNMKIQLKCGKCEEIFEREFDLQQHIRKICHLNVKCFACEMCLARFDNDHGLKVHRSVAHINKNILHKQNN